ncbi:MAG: SDR family oxidoreductase [Deltaproteobacteria bacterium]|nr:MAG: SDR family oxidoreductase [Deltaproteobacteria bacterium]
MNLCIVHRDRRSVARQVEPEFEKLRGTGVRVLTLNKSALDAKLREEILDALEGAMGERGRVRTLLHSVAFGSLKLIAPEKPRRGSAGAALATELGVDEARVTETSDALFREGADALAPLANPPRYPERCLDEDDLQHTIHAMGTSLLGWTQALLQRGRFASDARIIGLTSEGNEVAWKGYAAVAAAKVALESISRSMAVELAPYGIRANVIQAGITETPALQAIPGNEHLKAQARMRNPFGRLTTPKDVADAVYLLSTDEAAWINGVVLRVDGGEHISGATT